VTALGTGGGGALGTAVQWTLRDAAQWLRPVITEEQLSKITSALPGVAPIGYRPGKRGRPERIWDAADLIEIHAAVRRWL